VSGTESAPWFSFSDPAYVRTVLEEAGFIDIDILPHDELVGSGSLAAMVDVCSRVGALGAILRDHPHLAPAATAALAEALAERDGPTGPRLYAAIWTVSARARG
jgi:hypothetical protein